MNGSTRLFKLFGIQVQIHFSWWFIFALLSWGLATGFFPHYYEGLSLRTYWLMGIVSAMLLFLSVVLHELSHSIIAKLRGIKVESITLFFFGGVAGITDEDLSPLSEFLMAIAGPLFSLALAGVFFAINRLNGNVFISAITFYLYQINFILAMFNLVPGFPLDGGRAFRALLHYKYKDIKKATYIASKGGKIFAGILIFFGFLGFITGSGGGLWFILIGAFLYFIAGVSYDQVVIKDVLSKIPVKELQKQANAISPNMKFTHFLKKYAKKEEEAFLVKGKGFAGIFDLNRVQKMSKSMQDIITLKQMALPMDKMMIILPHETAYHAFRKFVEHNVDLLPIVHGKKIVGVITRRSVMHRLTWDLRFGHDKKNAMRTLIRKIKRR